jgi:hypothetical protein
VGEAKYTTTHKTIPAAAEKSNAGSTADAQVGEHLRVSGLPGPDMDKCEIMLYLAEKR